MEWVLASLLIITQAFWMYSQHILVNKIMSGSYATYTQAEKMLKNKPREPKSSADVAIKEDKEIEMLNNMVRSMGR